MAPSLKDRRRETMVTGMSNPYYSSGELLKAKNLRAGGMTLGFPAFALSKLSLEEARTAVDVGCGWGRFAVPLLERAAHLTQLVCIDVWPGMLATCRATIAQAGHEAEFVAADIDRLPLAGASADLVMANHMLYELDDVPTAVDELACVLSTDGQLLATTYSDALSPIQELHFATLAELGYPCPPPRPSSFSLDNGEALLRSRFEHVECHVLDEPTSITDAGAFLDLYLKTGGYDRAAHDENIPPEVRQVIPRTFLELTRRRLAQDVVITSVTRWTAFVGRGILRGLSPRRPGRAVTT
jgi:SAM-dependent methyltransferase